MTDEVALVRRSLAGTDEFDRRVRAQADRLAAAFEDAAYDSAAATLGLELELYAVDEEGRLAPVPADVFEGPAEKELGVHNAELNAPASAFDDAGIAAQAEAVRSDLAATRERAREHGLRLVLDGMPAVGPAGGTHAYFDDVTVDGGEDATGDGGEAVDDRSRRIRPGGDADDPVIVARNMRADPRYRALDNEAVRRAGGAIDFAVPGARLTFRTILFESLATSIQPHVQVPDVSAFPRYHNLAVRTLGPLLALSTNSPFLPGDCYDLDAAGVDVDDPDALVEQTHHELRVAAFEGAMNQGCRKVCVPEDLTEPADAVGNVVADETYAPFLREWIEGDSERPDDDSLDCWEFDYKRGTFWRWVRAVPGGEAVEGACDERSLRVEYRPLPTQPTVRDVVGLQVLTAGLLRGLVAADHPLCELPWGAAERSFYAAAEDGIEADLAWVTADGERTGDSDAIFEEVFAFARRGLDEQGVSAATRERYLAPLEVRWERGVTPSVWKKRRVREGLDEGLTLEEALAAMQREYVDLSRERESFAEWI